MCSGSPSVCKSSDGILFFKSLGGLICLVVLHFLQVLNCRCNLSNPKFFKIWNSSYVKTDRDLPDDLLRISIWGLNIFKKFQYLKNSHAKAIF